MRSIELFSGCGGLAFGIAEAGFRHDFVIEIDRNACSTLALNKQNGVRHFSEWTITKGDICDFDFSAITRPIGLVSGGPPCQPFSLGGKHKGPNDNRNMWPEAIRAVSELTPSAFIFENVKGLLRPAFSDYLDFIRLQLSWPELYTNRDWKTQLTKLRDHKKSNALPTYRVVIQEINAADYGAPQKRHRAIVMGIRSDLADTVETPHITHSREALIWSQRVTGAYWEKHKIPRDKRPTISDSDQCILNELLEKGTEPKELPWVTVRDAIGDLPSPTIKGNAIMNHILHPGARIYAGHTGSSWDEPAKALKAGAHGVPGGENVLIERTEVRYFTIREMMRLQGLPDDFVIDGSWVNAIKQLGNAVPVQVGKAFGNSIRKQLRAKTKARANHVRDFSIFRETPAGNGEKIIPFYGTALAFLKIK